MARTDMTLDELRAYRPQVLEPDDFDSFWATTLAESRAKATAVEARPVDTPLTSFDIFDVTFSGYAGDPVKAWLTLPKGAGAPLPAVVEYIGYGGGRDLAGAQLHWAAAGYAHLFMDTRGQGSVWSTGDTSDPHGRGPQAPGVMTSGIEDPESYYYRRLFTDAVRATDAVRELPGVDASRVAVQGGSQGGGITLAVAGLVPDLVGAMPDVPFLCNFRRAVDICARDPYAELTRYLSVHRGSTESVFSTLSYFDGVNFSKRAEAPGLFSVGLMDQVCPPSTVFSAYHAYAAEKSIETYEFNDHEGGGFRQRLRQIRWLSSILSR